MKFKDKTFFSPINYNVFRFNPYKSLIQFLSHFFKILQQKKRRVFLVLLLISITIK